MPTRTMPTSSERARRIRRLMDNGVRALIQTITRDKASDTRVREFLREACDAARSEGFRAEQILVILKDSWRALADEGRMQRLESDELLHSVVTLCIDEFYRMDPPPRISRPNPVLRG